MFSPFSDAKLETEPAPVTKAYCDAVYAPFGATLKHEKTSERPSPARVNAPCVLVDGTSVHVDGSASVCSSVPGAPDVGIAYSSRYTCATVVAVLLVVPAPMRSTTTEPYVSGRFTGADVGVGVAVGVLVVAGVRDGVGEFVRVVVGDGDGVPDADGVAVAVTAAVPLVDDVGVPELDAVVVAEPELDGVVLPVNEGVVPGDDVPEGDFVVDGVAAAVPDADGVTDDDAVAVRVPDADDVAVRVLDGDDVGERDAVAVCDGVGDVMDAMMPRKMDDRPAPADNERTTGAPLFRNVSSVASNASARGVNEDSDR